MIHLNETEQPSGPFLRMKSPHLSCGLSLRIGSHRLCTTIVELCFARAFTSILLVLLAGGLAGYGIHELVEYTGSTSWGVLGQPAYSLNIPAESPWHHKGVIGSVLAVMFGYTVKAEWVRLLVHLGYLAIVMPLVIRVYQRAR